MSNGGGTWWGMLTAHDIGTLDASSLVCRAGVNGVKRKLDVLDRDAFLEKPEFPG